jgi:inner membrane protein YidH
VRWVEGPGDEGREPDPRFTLANERTFLAWIRTSLALVAGGIGLEAFVPRLAVPGLRQVLSVCLVLLGTAVSATAWSRWVRTQRAMRLGAPLPVPRLAPLLSFGIAAIALITVVLLVVTQT